MESSHLNKSYLARRHAKKELPIKQHILLKHFYEHQKTKAGYHSQQSILKCVFTKHCSLRVETCKNIDKCKGLETSTMFFIHK